MNEAGFEKRIARIAKRAISQRHVVRLKAPLLYEVTVDHRLQFEVDPARPSRGQSAFETDLAIFERRGEALEIPRVVLELKTKISTHDVLTYSAKAVRHKRIYPYLRYGLIAARETAVPGCFYLHNEGLDFCVTLGAMKRQEEERVIARLLRKELRVSRLLERIALGETKSSVYRSAVTCRV